MCEIAQASLEYGPLRASSVTSRRRTLDTPAGPLFLQNFCPPWLVEELRADAGLRAFARRPEREYQLLLKLAKRPDAALTLAYTPNGEIVGQVTLALVDGWWQGLESTYEIAVEVSAGWRRLGIAQQLLTFALELEKLEQMIMLALGFAWHWDMEGLGLPAYRYRELIARLFAAHGFSEYLTAEPNVYEHPANILLVRIGGQVDRQSLDQFFNRLFHSESLPGL